MCPIDVSTPSPRLPEAVALFNAAFCAELLLNAIWEKEQDGRVGLSWPSAFLILPLVLHPPTRVSLPPRSSVSLAAWAVRNTELSQSMPARVAYMSTPTKRAIRFGMRHERFALSGTNLTSKARPATPNTSSWPLELVSATRAARLAGRWFRSVDAHTAFTLLGLGK